MTDTIAQIQGMIEALMKEEGYVLVECKVFFASRQHVVRCRVDRPAGGITLTECAQLNRQVREMIDEHGLWGDNYMVEVNSPGIDRPLTTKSDFKRVVGKSLSLWLHVQPGQRDCWEGVLLEVTELGVRLKTNKETIEICFDKIKVGKERIL